jgi:MFS family permease
MRRSTSWNAPSDSKVGPVLVYVLRVLYNIRMERQRLSLWRSLKRLLPASPAGDSQWAQQERNIRNLFLDTTSQGILAGGILAYFSVFIARLGGSSLLISLLTSLPALGVILFSIPAAQFVGRRRDVVRITVVGRLVIFTLYLLAGLLPFVLKGQIMAPILVALWALQAIPGSVANVSWTEVIAHSVPVERLARVNGARWATYSLVIAISVAAFGALLEQLPLPINYQIVFIISAGSGYLSAYFFSRIKMDRSYGPSASQGRASLGQQVRNLIAPMTESRPFLYYLIVGFVLRLGINLPAALYTIFWVKTLNATDQWIGWRTTAGSLALVAGYTFWGRSVARMGAVKALAICALGMALYPVVTAFVGAPAWLVPAALVWGFFASGIDITIFEGLLRISPQKNRTAYVAINTVLANLAIFLGPIFGSLVSDAIGIRPAFFVAAAVGVLGAFLVYLWRVGRPSAPPSEIQAT